MIRRLFAVLLAALAGLAAAAPVAPLVVPGESVVTEKAAPAPRLRLAAKAAVAARASLAPVAEAEMESLRKLNRAPQGKRLMIGINRDATPAQGTLPDAANLSWVTVDGGHAAHLALTSPGAAALRLAIDLRGVPLDVEMVVFGSGAAQLFGPVRVGDIADRTQPWWSAPTEGDTQTVEFFVPGARDPKSLGLRIAKVSHLFTSAASGFRKRTSDIGDSGSCNVDIQCITNPSQAFLNTRNAVAKMLFTVGAGTALCTGTLLNDLDTATQVPWFYGANHCFENDQAPFRTPEQMQQIASTLTTYWFFEAVSCGSLTPTAFVTRTSGAAYVYNHQPTDVLFLQLNEAAPAGSFLSGYSAQAFGSGQVGTAIHHPLGDLKKVSQGDTLGFSTPFTGATSQGYTEIRWFTGTTEGGSSGSGLWSFDGSQYLFRGGLYGGSALCTNLLGTDNYSRFDVAYPTLRQYLENAAILPFADFTDLWWGGDSESGWGLNLIQHPSNQIFGVWYTYGADGKRLWIVMSGGQWTSSGTFTGALYITSGSPYSTTFNPNSFHINSVGSGTLNFTSANAGTWSFTVNGISGVKTISRQPF